MDVKRWRKIFRFAPALIVPDLIFRKRTRLYKNVDTFWSFYDTAET
jgi:hypothetical protein